jgi:CheY-like chemotaxis protein/anti-sigma regulatory factor (Ser/Thr protein kinase)
VVIRVLLVDDVPDVRRMVRVALRFRGGFEVVAEAADGFEAVRQAEEQQPDVVVLDLGLPDLAGRDVLTKIHAATPRSKVVVFSGGESDTWVRDRVEGYVLKDVQIDYLVDLLQSVARDGAEASLELACEAGDVRLARRFVAEKVREWGLESLLDDALLVTSELAANAITHAGSACRIKLSLSAAALRIDVIDSGAGTPEPQPPSATEEHGRGLHLVAAMTTAWGLDVMPGDRKVVWAEFARPA